MSEAKCIVTGSLQPASTYELPENKARKTLGKAVHPAAIERLFELFPSATVTVEHTMCRVSIAPYAPIKMDGRRDREQHDVDAIRDQARKQALLEVAEELKLRAEGREDDIEEEQLGEYDTERIRTLSGEGRALLEAANDCRELAAKEENDG